MKKFLMLSALLCLIIAGCSTPSGKGAAIGGTGGAILGGVIGHQSGHGVEGAAIGAAAGAIGGALIGEHMTKKFCPVCGKQFTEDVMYCPHDGAELKYIEK